MNKVVPTYIYLELGLYNRFVCEMCGTCCRNEWLVTMSEDSYRRNEQLFKSTDRSDEFQQAFVQLAGCDGPDEYAYIAKVSPGGSCWFLDGTNCCRLHREAGHQHLDSVCQIYPRYPMNTARGLELTLSFSCPAVLKLVAGRTEPLTITRSDQPPQAMDMNAYAAQVFPSQQPINSPLRYYFEMEQHFIDILQCRSMTIEERLEFLQSTVSGILKLAKSDQFDRQLQQVFYKNYQLFDEKMAGQQDQLPQNWNNITSDILIEHFLVNLIFKKIGYLYGLESMVHLLQLVWRYTVTVRQAAPSQAAILADTEAAIIHLELQYSHNRKALLKMVNKQEVMK